MAKQVHEFEVRNVLDHYTAAVASSRSEAHDKRREADITYGMKAHVVRPVHAS